MTMTSAHDTSYHTPPAELSDETVPPVHKATSQSHPSDPPPAYEDIQPSRFEKASTTLREQVKALRLSHAWFLFWNLATIALTICVLSGCRTAPQAQYSLIVADGRALDVMMGCVNCNTSAVAEYKVGLSGACRVTNNGTKCIRAFPYNFNLASLIKPDISNGTEPLIDATYADSTSYSRTPHDVVAKIALALGILLALSAVIAFITLFTSLLQSSGFSGSNLLPLILDSLILLTCLGLFLAIFVYEIGVNYDTSLPIEVPSIVNFIGVGAWLLVAAFGCRLLSNPVLFLGFWIVVAFLALFPIAFALGCLAACCGSSSSSTSNSSRPTYSNAVVTTEPQTSDIMAVATVEQSEIEIKADGSYIRRVQRAYAMVTSY